MTSSARGSEAGRSRAASCPSCGRELVAHRVLRQQSRVLADGSFSYPFDEGEEVLVRCTTGHHLVEASSVVDAESRTVRALAKARLGG